MEFYQAIKRNKPPMHTIGINVKNIMLSNRRFTKRYIIYDSIFVKI